MPDELTYTLAKCCSPPVGCQLVGYIKEDGAIAVHQSNCTSLNKLRQERLLQVTWREIQSTAADSNPDEADPIFSTLSEIDYLILKHHETFGIDYSIAVSDALGIPLEETYNEHRKLKTIGGLKRVEKRIIQYRKNIVKGKWIKHRNHTYYELTSKGEKWIEMFESHGLTQDACKRDSGVFRRNLYNRG